MSEKAKLDKFIKQMKEGIPYAEDYIDKSSDIFENALEARDLSENALARQIMKETGIPIPNLKGATNSELEDVINRLVQERYPELKPDIRISGDSNFYDPSTGKSNISEFTAKKSLEDAVATGFHEGGGHGYDDFKGYKSKPLTMNELRKAKAKGVDLKSMDPMQVYEDLVGKGHHAEIPKLREGSYGFGGLKSLLKNKTFKSIPIVGPVLGAATAIVSGDSNAASALPILGDVENIAQDKFSNQEEFDRDRANELSKGEPLNSARLMALKNILKR